MAPVLSACGESSLALVTRFISVPVTTMAELGSSHYTWGLEKLSNLLECIHLVSAIIWI